jgi:hypothetical protein
MLIRGEKFGSNDSYKSNSATSKQIEVFCFKSCFGKTCKRMERLTGIARVQNQVWSIITHIIVVVDDACKCKLNLSLISKFVVVFNVISPSF